jgi:DNA-binding CsgD family transcriptional regulator/pimeloyl-ACP methyl ester carboxylesterase
MTGAAVHYVSTPDGYSIAYNQHGDGPLLVCLPMTFSHAEQVWTDSSVTPLLLALAERFRIVYYDSRGQGLSQRALTGRTTVDAFVQDLAAVLETVDQRPVVLLADNFWTHVAIRFASQAPERVQAVALMHCARSFANQAEWFATLARQNWDYYLDTQVGSVYTGSGDNERAAREARKERLRQRTTQDDWLKTLGAFGSSDVSGLLPTLTCPALVLHVRSQQWVSQEEATAVAALIHGSRLVSVSGAGFWGDLSQTTTAIENFMSTIDAPSSAVPSAKGALSALSARQTEVLRLLAQGKTNQEIASELVLSLRTVERHVNDIYARLGVRNRSEAVALALRHF